ncbi:MAG: hypothetical protein HKM93_07180 [Desulfobacteraceae bacterium]|nr:hypothetical protein [Desulfobacteraceae bacterium]
MNLKQIPNNFETFYPTIDDPEGWVHEHYLCTNCGKNAIRPKIKIPRGRLCNECVGRFFKRKGLEIDAATLSLSEITRQLLGTNQVCQRLILLWGFKGIMRQYAKGTTESAHSLFKSLVPNMGFVTPHPLAHAVREAAVRACVAAGEGVLPHLLAVRKPEPWQFFANIILSAGSIAPSDEKVRRLIKKGAADASPNVRRMVLVVLSDTENEWARHLFEALLVDTNPLVREAAAELSFRRSQVKRASGKAAPAQKKKARHPKQSPLEKLLDRFYAADFLQSIYEAYLHRFKDCFPDNRKATPVRRKPRKSDLVWLLAHVYSDKVLFLKLLSDLPRAVEKVLHRLVWDEFECDVEDLQSSLDAQIVNTRKEPYYDEMYVHLNPDYFIFTLHSTFDYRRDWRKPQRLNLRLPEDLRTLFKTYLPPPREFDYIPLEQPERTAYLFEDRGETQERLAVLSRYVQQGNVKYSKSGNRILIGSLKKMKEYLHIKEFYSEEDKDLRYLRTLLIAEFISEDALKTDIRSPEDLKSLFAGYFDGSNFKYYHAKDMLAHLKGGSHDDWNYEKRDMRVRGAMWLMVQNLMVDQWISLKNIFKFARYRGLDLEVLDRGTAEHYLYFRGAIRDSGDKLIEDMRIHIEPSIYDEAVIHPYLRGMMYLFAAFGLLDIAYDHPEHKNLQTTGKPYLSVFDGLSFIRLTHLGAYVFGQQDSYAIDFTESAGDLVLDENRLIIYLTQKDRLKSLLLENIGERVTDTCYRVNFQTFLKDCDTIGEIRRKITFFKEHISDRPPSVWAVFLNEITSKLNPMEPVENYAVFKLNPSRELVSLFATDKVLKKYVRKAEDFNIIVENRHISKVKKRLQTFGYFMDPTQK